MANEPTEARVVQPKKKKALRAYLVLAGLAGAALGAYFLHGYLTRDEVSTDDAQVDADVVPISSRVGGVIQTLSVHDNAPVTAKSDKSPDPIAQIDPADLLAKVEAAKAERDAAQHQAEAADAQIEIVKSTAGGGLSSARAQLQGTGASVRSAAAAVQAANAQLTRAQTELDKATSELTRETTLHDQGVITAQVFENAKAAHDGAAAMVENAKATLAGARDQQALAESRIAEAQGKVQQSAPVDVQVAMATANAAFAKARLAGAEEALRIAQMQLDYTKIYSPVDGFASKLAVHEGQLVQPGSLLLMVVPAKTYVIANFKETQIQRIRPGDAVDVSIDAISGQSFHGKVDSIAAATGARFSMMPPDNATGNFVKVVQRVPVKIVWDEGQDLSLLHAGLSAEVTVHLK